MTGLLPWAAPLLLAAVAMLCLPLLQRRADGTPPARALAAGLGAGVVVIGLLLYALLNNYPWAAQAERERAAQAAGVPQLVADAQAHRADARRWVALGAAYTKLGRWSEARAAFGQGVQASGGQDADALSGLGQVLVLGGEGQVDVAALRLFEQALQRDPGNLQALFYSGLGYLQAGRLAEARAQFVAMIARNPPQQVRDLLQKQVDGLEGQLAAQAQATASAIRLDVQLAPGLAGKVGTGASLFLFVPAPGGGPPLAAKRLQASFPQQATLSAADAMIAGHAIKAGDRVHVTARVSRTGSPTGSAGDLTGTLEAKAGDGSLHVLLIDSVTPAR